MFSPRHRNLIKGFLIAFKVNMIPSDCLPLSLLACYGCLVHKTSPLLTLINTLVVRNRTHVNEHVTWAGDFVISDPGYEMIAMNIDSIINNIELIVKYDLIYDKTTAPSLPLTTFTDYYDAVSHNYAIMQKQEIIKDSIYELKQDVDAKQNAVKNKQLELQKLNKSKSPTNKATDKLIKNLMTADWSHSDQPYSFNQVSKLIQLKLKNMFTITETQLLRYLIPFMNACISLDVIHLFKLTADKIGISSHCLIIRITLNQGHYFQSNRC